MEVRRFRWRFCEADDGTAVAILPRANVVKMGAQS